MRYYMLVCSDTETFTGYESAQQITLARLKKGMWPLFKGTRNRSLIKINDNLLFYLAGKKEFSQNIIAIGRVAAKEMWSLSKGQIDHEDVLSEIPEQVLILKNIQLIRPLPIRPYLDHLSFISKTARSWGGSLQGGCRQLKRQDFDILRTDIQFQI